MLYSLIPITVFLWEYAAKKALITFKPSSITQFVADQVVSGFYTLGRGVAYLSSFYTYLNFNEFIETAHDIVKPCFDLVTSPYHFLRGYLDTSLLYQHPYLVFMGTITILIVVSYLIYRYKGERIIKFLDSLLNTDSGRTGKSNVLIGKQASEVFDIVDNCSDRFEKFDH